MNLQTQPQRFQSKGRHRWRIQYRVESDGAVPVDLVDEAAGVARVVEAAVAAEAGMPVR